MKTTIEIPDSLLHRAESVSARRKITLRQLVIESLERTVSETLPAGTATLAAEDAGTFEIGELGYPVLKAREVPPPAAFLQQIETLRQELGV